MSETRTILRRLVQKHLKNVDASTPSLKKYVDTPEGFRTATDMVYSICSHEGISVQAAMSQVDSDL